MTLLGADSTASREGAGQVEHPTCHYWAAFEKGIVAPKAQVLGSKSCRLEVEMSFNKAPHRKPATGWSIVMKKFLLGTVSLFVLGMAAPASAADLAARPYTKAPPPAVALYDWSGFYIGANGGWGSGRKCWDIVSNALTPGVITTFPTPIAEGCHDASGGTVGGQIGYRWQASS